jgi:hypothetical protein
VWEHFIFNALVLLFSSHYAITTSSACIDCPTFDELNAIFPDTSNQQVSGHFEDGIRQKAPMKQHFQWYRYSDQSVIWLDPPADIITRANHIEIVNEVQPYKLGVESMVMHNNTAILGKDRWVDDRCNNAIIPKDNWIMMLGDTIRYMKHDCNPEFTSINSTMYIKTEKSFQDITTSYKWQLEKWISEVKEKCLLICKEY